ncbi:hypothetical protein MGN01_28550 [Methylobacterium gnaphalii]|uniref:Uncharacterized protein n=1 Tax=Methylobacterium gnaphalii TaxID=1010610 RepID=A0A512JM26_9HYPH|nr:hypothetical protein MGN01_28550 [Methylobacterium gnaphalii]
MGDGKAGRALRIRIERGDLSVPALVREAITPADLLTKFLFYDLKPELASRLSGERRGVEGGALGGGAMPASVVSPIAAPGGKGRRKVCPGCGGVRRGNAPGFGRPCLGDTEMLSASSTTGRRARKEVATQRSGDGGILVRGPGTRMG